MSIEVSNRWLVLLLGSVFFFAACAGPREAATEEPEEPLPEPMQVRLADYETFDPTPYEEAAPAEEVSLAHDVPEKLMEGRATAGIARNVQGFRIQISNVPSKAEADAQLEDFVAWWREQKQQGTSGTPLFRRADPPVYIAYRQPYYRVRVGDFVSRIQAEQILPRLRDRYPGALIVPDMVTITQ